MDKLCRVCIECAIKSIPLSNKIGNSSSPSFLDFFNKCTNLNASESDKLPQNICSNCANRFQTFHSLVKLAEKSDKVFRESLKTSISTERYDNREISCEEITISNGETKEKILVLDARSIANLQDADDSNDCFLLEESGQTENEKNEPKDLVLIDSEEMPLSTSKKKLYSDKVECEPIKRIDPKSDSALDVLTNQNLNLNRVLLDRHNKKLHMLAYRQVEPIFKLHGNHTGTTDDGTTFTVTKFKCAICNSVYKHKSSLRKHMEIHKGITYKKKVNRHLDLHRGENPFECETCGKRFSHKGTYNEHLDVHSNTSYLCPYCHKVYKSKKVFRWHIKGHTGKREPFKCNFCHTTFQRSYGLKVHILNFHTGQIPFTCETCHNKFYSEYRYTRHIKNCIKIVPANSQNIENGDHVNTELSEEIKITTAQEPLGSLCGETEEPVLYYYKAKDLDDNNYFEITDKCITESIKNS